MENGRRGYVSGWDGLGKGADIIWIYTFSYEAVVTRFFGINIQNLFCALINPHYFRVLEVKQCIYPTGTEISRRKNLDDDVALKVLRMT